MIVARVHRVVHSRIWHVSPGSIRCLTDLSILQTRKHLRDPSLYRVIHQVMGRVWLNVFFESPLLAISFQGSMAAAIWPNGLRNSWKKIQPNPSHDLVNNPVSARRPKNWLPFYSARGGRKASGGWKKWDILRASHGRALSS